MRRYSNIMLAGKDNIRLKIILLYRPCNGNSNDGNSTIWKQQWARVQDQGWREDYNPQKQLMVDIGESMAKRVGNDAIVSGYFNEVAKNRLTKVGTLECFLVKNGITDVHEQLNDEESGIQCGGESPPRPLGR